MNIKIKVEQVYQSHKGLYEDEAKFGVSLSVLRSFQEYSKTVARNKESKNQLEARVFAVQDIASNEAAKKFASAAEIEEAKQIAGQVNDWLNGDESRGASYVFFEQKIKPLNDFFAKFTFRKEQSNGRPKALSEMHDKLDTAERGIRNLSDTKPWISDKDRKAGIAEIEKMRSDIETRIKENNALKPSVDPSLTIEEIGRQGEEALKVFEKLKATPKPKPKEKKEEKKEEPKKEEEKKDEIDL